MRTLIERGRYYNYFKMSQFSSEVWQDMLDEEHKKEH